MDAPHTKNRDGGWLAWLFLLMGLAIAGVAYWQGKVLVERELGSQLDLRAEEAKYSVAREVDRYAELLRGVQIQFLIHPDLSRRTFQQIAYSLQLDTRLPGIQAIAFTQRIAPGLARAFQESVQREFESDSVGYPPPVIHPRLPSEEAFVVQYVEPATGNHAGAWYNQASEAKRRAAIERARDTGTLSASGRVRLAVAPENHDGVLFFLPVYRGGAIPETLEARRDRFLGVVFLVIRVDEMLREVFGLALLDDLKIQIYDMQDSSKSPISHHPHNLIFDSGIYQHGNVRNSYHIDMPLRRDMGLDVGGSQWHVDVSALPRFVSRSQAWLPPIAAAMGVLLSLLLFYFLRALELSRQSLHAHARTAEATAHLRERAIEACANAIVVTSASAPDYAVEYVNSAFERITGYPADEIIGRSPRLLVGCEHEQPGISEIRALVGERREGSAIIHSCRKDGTPFWSEVHVAPVKDSDSQISHFVAAIYDITATKKYEAELEFQVNRDTLTGLANRNLLRDRLAQAIAYAHRYGHPVWVVVVDLDRFKFVVDTLGLAEGDRLLKAVGERLLSTVRQTDTVARLVGDEFVLVLPERADEKLAPAVVQRIIDMVAQPVDLAGHEYFPSCSAGVAVYPTDGHEADTLVKYASVAVYRAKEMGRRQFQFYTPTMNERSMERLRLESDLRNAIVREELLLHYQPQVDLNTGRIVGMEALLRWQHPELGLLPPMRFIGLAEETGLIIPIGDWVLRTACRQNKVWQHAGLGHLRVAVNLSVRQFAQPDLVQSIALILQETQLDPHCLDIELTESLVMTDVDHAVCLLQDLKALGVHVSIDDFGTGYSSLSYLKRFPIDVLKIDKSFVHDITTNPNDGAIARSIISMAHSLRLQVIAEGVETPAQLAYLRRHSCDQIQGYCFSLPVPADVFERFLQEDKSFSFASGTAGDRRQTLLIVDDEAHIVSALHRLLRQEGYLILNARTADEAFELLALHQVQVIICDYQMPDVKGSEFLSMVKQLHPDVIRIMLSGFSKLDTIIDTINRGEIYRYFIKPWDDEVMRNSVREAFRHYWLLHGTGTVGDAE